MKNNIIFLAFIFLIIGCSTPLNKSICKELTIGEIREINKKDTSFFSHILGWGVFLFPRLAFCGLGNQR